MQHAIELFSSPTLYDINQFQFSLITLKWRSPEKKNKVCLCGFRENIIYWNISKHLENSQNYLWLTMRQNKNKNEHNLSIKVCLFVTENISQPQTAKEPSRSHKREIDFFVRSRRLRQSFIRRFPKQISRFLMPSSGNYK